MKPIVMTLSAWGPYKEEERVDFSRFDGNGLFLITGPTGSGKTTIFDGITFALFGETSGEMREREALRSDFSSVDTETFVSLSFSHFGKVYHIRRSPKYLRPKKRKSATTQMVEEKERAVLFLPDGTTVEGTREVNKKVQEILALDYRQFKQTTMLAQGEFTKLLYATPQDKTKIFREIFGTTMYEKFGKALKEKTKALALEKRSLQDKMDEAIEQVVLKEEVWKELIEREYRPYEQIKDYLEGEIQRTKEETKTKAQELERLDILWQKAGEALEKAKRSQEKLLEKEKTEKSLSELLCRQPEMDKRREKVSDARKAGYVEPFFEKWQQQKRALLRANEKTGVLEKKKTELDTAMEKLVFLKERDDFFQEFFLRIEYLRKKAEELRQKDKQTDEAEKELFKVQKQYEKAELLVTEKKALYEGKDRERKRAAIGIAASLLEEGKPCPVCGSVSHPQIAKLQEEIVSEEALDSLKKAYERENEELFHIYGQASARKEKLEVLLSDKKELAEWVKQEEKEVSRLFLENRQAFQMFRPGVEWEQLLHAKNEEFQQFFDTYEKKKEKLSFLEKEGLSVSTLLADARRESELQEKQEQTERKLFEQSLRKQRLQSEELFLRSRLEPEELEKEAQCLEQYQKKLHALTKQSDELERQCRTLQKEDIASLREKAEEKRALRDGALKEKERLDILLDSLRQTVTGFTKKLIQWEAVQKEYGIVKNLEDVTYGNNEKRLVFEQYVLIRYFEEIIEAANLRFAKMTGNRFLLERVEEVSDGRTKDNLELAVFDFYTGKSRSVKTLSGGEAFKASLSLSLGLSDVIQQSSGGICVETLFVDEGFGSLDGESLDQAIKALYSLVEHDRLIGIISHVSELQERIPGKIVVEKSAKGSKIHY